MRRPEVAASSQDGWVVISMNLLGLWQSKPFALYHALLPCCKQPRPRLNLRGCGSGAPHDNWRHRRRVLLWRSLSLV